jgi:phage baseplate assembly protein W
LPEFGIGQLYELLYSPIDKYTLEKINLTMKSILNLWEPRIYVLSIPIDYDDSSITMTINYTIPALNDETDSFVYSVSK